MALQSQSKANGHSQANAHAVESSTNFCPNESSGGQARDFREDRDALSSETVYATSNGCPMPHPYTVQRAGVNGPLLLQDFHLVDLLSHFDRERVPERVVHAKGGGAREFFGSLCTFRPDVDSARMLIESLHLPSPFISLVIHRRYLGMYRRSRRSLSR